MTERNYNEKLRAVFLAAIMVTSVFAGTVALSGTAAAANLDAGSPGAGNVQYDSTLVFQGQNNEAEVAGLGSSTDTAELRRVTGGYDRGNNDAIQGSNFVEEIDADRVDSAAAGSDARFIIDTDDLEAGDYILVNQDGSTNTVEQNTFEVSTQSLSAEFGSDEALVDSFGDSNVELDLSSGRSGFSTNVTANGDLDRQELFNVFVQQQLDSVRISSADVSSTSDAWWNVTDEGRLEARTAGDSLVDDATSGTELSFDSPWNALTSASSINFGVFGTIADETDLEATHNGDVIDSPPSAGAFGTTWSVALYDPTKTITMKRSSSTRTAAKHPM
ncbi:surface glycoprotein [Halonotius sp. GCM10025705]|uniref:surface glycoprotein n=1 Tax=Halonotius sp. GCM10025705 TaxID=3252678 RepID=UPI003611D0C7